MSRSGYSKDYDCYVDYPNASALYHANVERSIKGKRGRSFFQELANALDAMPEKFLISHDLIDDEGGYCAMGAVFKARGLDTREIDPHDPDQVGKHLGITECMAREISFQNDDDFNYAGNYENPETPAQRWIRMRAWVAEKLK